MVEEYYILQSKKRSCCCALCDRCKKKGRKCKSENLEKFFYEQLLKEHNKMRSRLGYKTIDNDPNLLNEARKCCNYITTPDNNNVKTVCVYYDYEIRDPAGNIKAVYKQIDCFVVRKACTDGTCERKHGGGAENNKLIVGILYAGDKIQQNNQPVSTNIPEKDCKTLSNIFKVGRKRKK